MVPVLPLAVRPDGERRHIPTPDEEADAPLVLDRS